MNYTLRIGAFSFPGIVGIEKDGKSDGKCKTGDGLFGDIFQQTLDNIWKGNCTLTETIIGAYEGNGTYSGGLGMIQRNELDLVNMYVSYPQKGEGFSYMPIFGEESPHIASSYFMSNMTIANDVCYLFATFGWEFWTPFLLTVLVFIIMLNIGRWLLEGQRGVAQPVWIVSMFTLDQDYLHESNAFLYILSVTMSFFFYFMIQWLTGNMSTDLVVITDPVVVKGYDDILNRADVMPMWLKGWPDYEVFKYAPEGSIEQKVWQKTLEISQRENRSYLVDLDMTKLTRLRGDMDSQRAISLVRGSITKILVRFVSRFTVESGNEDHIKGMFSKDPAASSYMSVFALSEKVPFEVVAHLRKMFLRMTEGGIITKTIDDVIEGTIPNTIAIQNVYSDKIKRNHPPLPFVALKNVEITLMALLGLFAIESLVLLCEICYHRWVEMGRIKRERSAARKVRREERRRKCQEERERWLLVQQVEEEKDQTERKRPFEPLKDNFLTE